MSRILIFMLLSVGLLLGACSKKITQTATSDSKNKFLDIDEVDFEYFESRTKIKYNEDRQKITGNANIRIKKDSLIWLSISPSLGIEVTRSIITPDTIIVINRMDKEYYTFNFKQLSDYFSFQIDFNLLQSILMANLPIDIRPQDEITSIPGYTKVNQKSGLLLIDSYVNSDLRKIETVIIKELFSQNQLSLKYSNFTELQNSLFPKLCMVNLTYDTPNGPLVTSVDIEHNRVEVFNDKPLKFPFSVPDKYVHK